MRVRVEPDQRGLAETGGRGARVRRPRGPQSARHQVLHGRDGGGGQDGGRGAREACGVSALRESGSGAGALCEFDGHRFFAVWRGRADPVREEQRDRVGGEKPDGVQDGPHGDGPAGGYGAGGPIPGTGRQRRAGGGRTGSLGGRDGYRRLQSGANGNARMLRRFHRSGGAGVAEPGVL
ncbi:hypothetical protein D3C72_1833740 [compost metagenome]